MILSSKQLSSVLVLCLLILSWGCKPTQPIQTGEDILSGTDNVTQINGGFQVPPGMTETLAARYKEDAYRLALRDLLSRGGTGELQADIPVENALYFYDKLIKSWKIFRQSDTLPDLSYIHTWPHPNMNRVILAIAEDATFRENWSQGVVITDNLYLNQITSKYRLEIEKFRDARDGSILELVSPFHINTPSLSIMLAEVPGISYCEPMGVTGDGNDIILAPGGKSGRLLKFSIGAGDCPSGCIHRKNWIFMIQEDGNVRFDGIEGDIPEGMDGGGERE